MVARSPVPNCVRHFRFRRVIRGAFAGAMLAGVLLTTSAGGATRAPIGSGLLRILGGGTADATIFVAGDSTGDEASEWVYQLAWQLGYRYPAYHINYYLWDKKRRSWPAAPLVILQGAPGGPALNVWNMSVSGARENYALAYAEKEIVPKQPDLMFVSYGLNDETETARFRWGIQSLVDSVSARAPDTEIVLIAQNPAVGNAYQQARASELELLASQEGLGFVNVYGSFHGPRRSGRLPDPGRLSPQRSRCVALAERGARADELHRWRAGLRPAGRAGRRAERDPQR